MLRESILYKPVIKLFRDNGFKTYEREIRIPMSRKRVDLVFFKIGEEEKKVAVELKVNKWEEAIFQAYINTFFFSKAYVALWHEAVKEANIGIFKHYNVGLIEVNKNKARIIYG
ncbi:MAG: hypothetical protein WED07_16375 [Candidatus Freyarchaeum deiterrae]